MAKEKKGTFTYSARPSVRNAAVKRADKVGESISEVIDLFLEAYANWPIFKQVATKTPVKTTFVDVDDLKFKIK